ncbi:MAG: hypothetical protein LKJ81_02055 [Bacilli bacterium]|jgi:pyrrolidone-carboxylate peptidase|nr:hypothetical protein [Bacilli bacterium]MCH4277589.1 hypothetical protein [Bacilli bacterium]MCI2054928.1 hypothetical protein [Bacilli bacterium]
MKTLLTGFEPFLDNSVNPSKELIKDSDFIDVATIVLPVSYKNAKKLLEKK